MIPESTDQVAAVFGADATAERSYGLLTVDVPPDAWVRALRTARDDLGCTFFDWLSAVDEPDTGFQVCAHLVAPHGGTVETLLVRTTVPHASPRVDTAVDVYAGAAWHERETHEMFGISFTGHPDLAPLLLPEGFEGHPLRKDFVLAARVVKAWPGAKEPGESGAPRPGRRRQQLPPGVPDPAVWGPHRDEPAATPAPQRPARADRPGPASSAPEPAPGGERPRRPRRNRSASTGSASQRDTQTPGDTHTPGEVPGTGTGAGGSGGPGPGGASSAAPGRGPGGAGPGDAGAGTGDAGRGSGGPGSGGASSATPGRGNSGAGPRATDSAAPGRSPSGAGAGGADSGATGSAAAGGGTGAADERSGGEPPGPGVSRPGPGSAPPGGSASRGRGPRRNRSASGGSASQRDAQASGGSTSRRDAHASGGDRGSGTGGKPEGVTGPDGRNAAPAPDRPAARPDTPERGTGSARAPRASDAPWHHARPAFEGEREDEGEGERRSTREGGTEEEAGETSTGDERKPGGEEPRPRPPADGASGGAS